MGTYAVVDLPGDRLPYEVFKIIREVEKKISTFIEDSEISKINKFAGKKPVRVSPLTLRVLKEALRISGLTGGKFDITIGSYTINHLRKGSISSNEALSLIDYRRLQIKGRMVFLEREHMAIDLGAIGKGFALDVVREKMSTSRGFVSVGGDMILWGHRRVLAIRNPFVVDNRPIIQMLALKDLCISTSGNYHRNHIFQEDPELVQVTVVYEKCSYADALATALFAMDKDQRRSLIKMNPELGVVEIYRDRSIWFSPGFFRYFTDVFIRY
jgi:thiamine biosynthesis lipoprotein